MANAAPRCGAQSKRTGKPCRAAAMPNGRCKVHGGKSTGPRTPEGLERSRRANWKHGYYSREAKAEQSRVRRKSVVKVRPKLESAECSDERTAHALRTSPKIVDHHMPTHDIRRADVEHRWTRARSSSSHAGHDYRLHHSGDGFECVRSFDASWPWLTAGRSPRTARHKLEPLAVLHLLRAPQGSPRQRPMPQEPAPPASCAPAGPRQGVSDPSPDAPARSAWERA
jgi:hypothetical protein